MLSSMVVSINNCLIGEGAVIKIIWSTEKSISLIQKLTPRSPLEKESLLRLRLTLSQEFISFWELAFI